MRSKRFADLRLNGAEVYGGLPVLRQFREFEPFLRHLQKMRTNIRIRRVLR
jgi:hypothetical protein